MATPSKKFGKAIQGVVVILFLVVSMFAGSLPAVNAQSGAEDLFGASTADSAQLDLSAAPYVMRSRFVSVNLDLLIDAKGKARGADQLPQVSLNIFPDARFTGLVDKVEKSGATTSWTGPLADMEDGYFYLVVSEGVFIAHVASPEGVYEISSVGEGVYQAIQIDQSVFTDDPPVEMPVGQIPAEADAPANGDSGATIDIMVVYTSAALSGEGSLAALKARVALAVTETNTSYAHAGVTTRLRLVHMEQVTYTETGNIGTDLNRLAGTSDGYMDVVHSLRNIYAADMVGLIVENGGAYCGMATSIMSTAANAFQVTARSCATGYYSFGHEFGHLQGARHDPYVDNSTTPYAFGHGYVNPGSTTPTRWRTVMAYNDRCSDYGFSCTRLQYWSNPSKTYGGLSMGNSASQNYAVLNITDTTVANFRTAVIGSNFSNNFNSSASGWSAAKGSWALSSSAYYRSLGLAGKIASAKHTGKYGDLTYTVKMKRTGTCVSCANRVIIRGNPASFDPAYSWKPSLVFQYANTGSFSVYLYNSAGTATALKGWTASAAIVKNGWNTLKVVAVGSSLKFYINNSLVWSGSNSALRTGTVGFGFYRDTKAGTLFVDSASLSTTPTADVNPNADVALGEELGGGSVEMAPLP